MNVLDKSYDSQKISECLITTEKECSYRKIFEEYLRGWESVPAYTMELWSIKAIKRCVMRGLDISYLPLMTVKDEILEERLKVIPCDGDFKQIFSQVIYHTNKWVSPSLSMFIDITLKHARGWSYVKATC
ncbi:hypothetical protein KFD70_22910 [Bacillus pfraonensis]|uniref:LysR substrate-binding domain-containing protein n=1 Tax=Bacillus TaxID=1386 RepID=UPI002A546674|nr:hypothetical protein [Bacillus pseudomycoides]